jgi:hypothetical protein
MARRTLLATANDDVAALTGDVKQARMFKHARGAVAGSVGSAVEAHQWLKVGIELDDQPIGARRVPGFENAHLLESPALDRLEKRTAVRDGRRDPKIRVDLVEHAAAIAVLAQNKLDQLGARCKYCEPQATIGGGREPRRIARQIRERRLRLPRTRGIKREQTMRPAFRDDDAAKM